MGPGVTSRHPSQELAIVDDKVGEGELMRVEEEGRDTERHDRNPEVDQVWCPDRQGDIDQEHDRPQTQVDRWPSETRAERTMSISTGALRAEKGDILKNAERDTGSGETTPGSNVSSSTEVQVAQDRVRVDLS